VKWLKILRQLVRDVLFTGIGVWIIWKQVESQDPNTALLVFAGACFWPAARSAVATILSGPGQSSESPAPPAERPSPPSSSPPEGGTRE
jgi:hypothetical protein